MKHKEFKVGKDKLPCAFSTEVIMRMYKTEKELRDFWVQYNDSKLNINGSCEPSDIQYKAADMKKKGARVVEIAKKLSMKDQQVYNAVKRVAIWNFLNSYYCLFWSPKAPE